MSTYTTAKVTNEALIKIAKAMQRETLPMKLEVRNHGGIGIDLALVHQYGQPVTGWQLEQAHVLDWLRKNYPGGEVMDAPLGGTARAWSMRVPGMRRSDGYRRTKQLWFDAKTWQITATASTPLIFFGYAVEHECHRFTARARIEKGELRTTDRLSCDVCGKPAPSA